MIKVKILDHPLIKMKLTKMRDENTGHTDFRNNLNEIASLMVYEILRDYQPKTINVKTPTGFVAQGATFNKEILIVPILRAGLGMVEGILELVPEAHVGHIGLFRDEKTLMTHEYFYKMPKVDKESQVIIVDPMLATGNSLVEAVSRLKNDGFTNIKLVCLVGSPEGIKTLETKLDLDVELYIAALDQGLNEKGFIIPGLGDAGDRIFGTK